MKSSRIAMNLVLLALSVVFLSGCVSNMFPGGPTPAGALVTNVKGPAQNLTIATDVTAASTKTGTSSASGILGLFAFGDASMDAAMKNGGITKVHHVDYEVSSILFGLFLKSTTIVHGE